MLLFKQSYLLSFFAWGFYLMRIFSFFAFMTFSSLSFSLLSKPGVPDLGLEAKQVILMDFHSGAILYEKNAYERTAPSSMTKVATIYQVANALDKGVITLDQKLFVSDKARKQTGSRMFVEARSYVSVEDLIKGTIVSSGNDSAVVLAEGLGGTEKVFAAQMTQKAHELGAKDTNFVNASGFPSEEHYSTVYDLATISAATIRDFPDFYSKFYHLDRYKYNGIEQPNRNTLLRYKRADYKVDGIKTGHTEAGGYGLAFSAVKDGTRVLGVINGVSSERNRIKEARALIEWSLRQTRTFKLMVKDLNYFSLPVEGGELAEMKVNSSKDIYLSYLALSGLNSLSFRLETLKAKAPIAKGEHVANLFVDGGLVADFKVPLYASSEVKLRGLISSLFARAKALFVAPEKKSQKELLREVKDSLLLSVQ